MATPELTPDRASGVNLPELAEWPRSRDDIRAASARVRAQWLSLRARLIAVDALATFVAWCTTLVAFTVVEGASRAAFARDVAVAAAATVTTLVLVLVYGLYRARVTGIRSIEIARLGRVSTITLVVLLLTSELVDGALGVPELLSGAAAAFVAVGIARGVYAAWLRNERRRGRFCRPTLVVGGDAAVLDLCELIDLHPEAGYRVVGTAGSFDPLEAQYAAVSWLGDLDSVDSIVEESGIQSVFVTGQGIRSDRFDALLRDLVRRGAHVHLSSVVRGVSVDRLRPLPFAYEPFYYIEPTRLFGWQRVCKRALDLLGASIVALLTLPIVGVAALAVKLSDHGPVLFKQTRIGRDGVPFTLFKIRTMVPDADRMVVDLAPMNQRQGGPLFKVAADPRRTRVGRILERASIDELPQIWNVLRGDMSLVGPRPALPREVALFDDELLDRHLVLPGITGLWQVEARDNAAFAVYRRLDLFYVENWSIGLDLAILLRTAGSVFGRVFRRFLFRDAAQESMVDLTAADPSTGSWPGQTQFDLTG